MTPESLLQQARLCLLDSARFDPQIEIRERTMSNLPIESRSQRTPFEHERRNLLGIEDIQDVGQDLQVSRSGVASSCDKALQGPARLPRKRDLGDLQMVVDQADDLVILGGQDHQVPGPDVGSLGHEPAAKALIDPRASAETEEAKRMRVIQIHTCPAPRRTASGNHIIPQESISELEIVGE